MNYEEFKEKMVEVVNGAFEDSGFSLVKTDPTILANGVMRETYMFCETTHEKEKVVPIIYPEEQYKHFINSDKSFEEVMELLVTSLSKEGMGMKTQKQAYLKKLSDLNYVQNHIFVRVLNMDKNKELLKNIPHRLWNDLAVYCEIVVMENPDGTQGSVKVSNSLLKGLGISEYELFKMAYANTQKDGFVVTRIGDIDPLLALIANDDVPMLVCTNKKCVKGANFILFGDQLKMISDQMGGGNFIILPSSIHEVICIPDNEEESFFIDMVKDVNRTSVEPEEVLSNTSYRYIAAEDKVVIMESTNSAIE